MNNKEFQRVTTDVTPRVVVKPHAAFQNAEIGPGARLMSPGKEVGGAGDTEGAVVEENDITIELQAPDGQLLSPERIATEEEANNESRMQGYGIVLSPTAQANPDQRNVFSPATRELDEMLERMQHQRRVPVNVSLDNATVPRQQKPDEGRINSARPLMFSDSATNQNFSAFQNQQPGMQDKSYDSDDIGLNDLPDDVDVKNDPNANARILSNNLNSGGSGVLIQSAGSKNMLFGMKGQLLQPGGTMTEESLDIQGQGGASMRGRVLHDPAIMEEMAQNISNIDPRSDNVFSISGMHGLSEINASRYIKDGGAQHTPKIEENKPQQQNAPQIDQPDPNNTNNAQGGIVSTTTTKVAKTSLLSKLACCGKKQQANQSKPNTERLPQKAVTVNPSVQSLGDKYKPLEPAIVEERPGDDVTPQNLSQDKTGKVEEINGPGDNDNFGRENILDESNQMLLGQAVLNQDGTENVASASFGKAVDADFEVRLPPNDAKDGKTEGVGTKPEAIKTTIQMPDKANTVQSHNTPKGSMRELVKHRPKRIRLNTDPVEQNKFFTETEGTPVKPMKTALDLTNFEKKKVRQVNDQRMENEISKKKQYTSIFESNIFVVIATWSIRIIGALVLSINLILDTSYIFLSTFASRGYYGFYSLLLVIRYMIPLLGVVRFFINSVNKPLEIKDAHKNGSLKSSQARQRVDKEAEYFKKGTLLYASLPFCFLMGTHRLLNFKNFNSEMSVGLVMDFFMAGVAFLLVQALNHGSLNASAADADQEFTFTGLQSTTVVMKFVLLATLLVEFVLYFIEMYQFNKFRTQASMNRQKAMLSEKKRRRKFANQYAVANGVWLAVLALITIIISATVDPQKCRIDQASSNYSDLICENCLVENCGQCSQSGFDKCDQCEPGFYLQYQADFEIYSCIDDECKIDKCTSCDSSGPYYCDTCEEGFSLSEISHCKSDTCVDPFCKQCSIIGAELCDICLKDYKLNKVTGVCERVQCASVEDCKTCGPNSAVCDQCLQGYAFDADKGRCIVDTSCIVDNCQVCQNREVCNRCEPGFWLSQQDNTCNEGSCLDPRCKKCSSQGPATCDECGEGFFLINNECKSTSCEPGFKFNIEQGLCQDSVCKVNECFECTKQGVAVCDKCNPGYWLEQNNECIDATCVDPNCRLCNEVGPSVCNYCQSGFVLSDTNSCLSTTCEPGQSFNYETNRCKSCIIDNCQTCSQNLISAYGCDLCQPGYILDRSLNSCVPEGCAVDRCGECASDRAICDKCAAGYWLTQENTCVDATCLVSDCQLCNIQGPTACDKCEQDFALVSSGLCKSTICSQDGFEFNFSTEQCEDVICKIDKCADCATSGIFNCDACERNFFFDKTSGSCLPDPTCAVSFCSYCPGDRYACQECASGLNLEDKTCVNPLCQVDKCANCDNSDQLCEQCATGNWLNKAQDLCVDATCQVSACEVCSINGPTICDKCNKDFSLFSNECRSTTCQTGWEFNTVTGECQDTVCKIDQCKNCETSGIQLCDVCNTGFKVGSDGASCIPDCVVNDCDVCSDVAVCDQCNVGFWLTGENTCIVDTCKDANCDVCDSQGPSVCDQCRDNFVTLTDGSCKSTFCSQPGFKFNYDTNECEDTVCKIKQCAKCDNSGIFGCDQCEPEYVYDWSNRCLFDTTCRIDGCAKCETDLNQCDECSLGLWFDQNVNACIDVACLIDDCVECSSQGPATCDKCATGLFLKNNKCVTCQDTGCETCSDADTCIKCAAGLRLENGDCLECDQELCEYCNLNGICDKCKPGYFIDQISGTCKACPQGCYECANESTCLLCNPTKHIRQKPIRGQCPCDQTKGWYQDDENPYDCKCLNDWLTADGYCTSCADQFKGCGQCAKVTANVTETFTDGVAVVNNKDWPKTVPGTYICLECSITSYFYNYDQQVCMRCDKDVNGCKSCDQNGTCQECNQGFALNDNGGCFDCDWHTGGCEVCSVQKCVSCKESYFKLADFCFPKPF